MASFDDLTPVNITVTKGQFKAAFEARDAYDKAQASPADGGNDAATMRAFGASEAAGYFYPDNQEMRAAFVAGAAWCSPSPAGERETAWLIERQYPINGIGATKPHWYAERPNGYHWWTDVPNRAKRFASKAAAEADTAYSLIASDPAISITEHVWINDGFSWSHGQVLYDRGHTVICPDCRGNRRTANGLLCSRCGGTAQISRSALRAGEIAPFEANPSPSPAGGERMGGVKPCNGEQYLFEEWAKRNRYDMCEHPLHYIFMDAKTNAARMGWKAALAYAEKVAQEAVDALAAENATLRRRLTNMDLIAAIDHLEELSKGRSAYLTGARAALQQKATP